MGITVSKRDVFESATLDADIGAILYASKYTSRTVSDNDAADQARGVHLNLLRDLVEKDENKQVLMAHE